MSVLLAVTSQVVQAVATATPSPSPHVVQVATTHVNTLSDTINALASKVSVEDVIAAAAGVAAVLQAYLNKLSIFQHAVKEIQALRRFVLAVVLPTALVLVGGLATNSNTLHLAPAVFLVAQFIYYVFKRLTAPTIQTTAVTETAAQQF